MAEQNDKRYVLTSTISHHLKNSWQNLFNTIPYQWQ